MSRVMPRQIHLRLALFAQVPEIDPQLQTGDVRFAIARIALIILRTLACGFHVRRLVRGAASRCDVMAFRLTLHMCAPCGLHSFAKQYQLHISFWSSLEHSARTVLHTFRTHPLLTPSFVQHGMWTCICLSKRTIIVTR